MRKTELVPIRRRLSQVDYASHRCRLGPFRFALVIRPPSVGGVAMTGGATNIKPNLREIDVAKESAAYDFEGVFRD